MEGEQENVVERTEARMAALRARLPALQGKEHKRQRTSINKQLYALENGDEYTGWFENDLFHGPGRLTRGGQTWIGKFNRGVISRGYAFDADIQQAADRAEAAKLAVNMADAASKKAVEMKESTEDVDI